MLAHSRRKVLHFNVTQNPASRWSARQIIEASDGAARQSISFEIVMRSTEGHFKSGFTAPLNVSREILQESRDVEAIKNGASSAPSACSDLAGADQGAAKAALNCYRNGLASSQGE